MSRKTILLVDDSKTTLFMEEMLLGDSFHLVKAQDGESALAAATEHRPDLVLLDVVMPGIDGFEVCRRLRQDEATREIPIILVTTRGESGSVERGFVQGCTDYVTKPINGAQLVSKIRHCLPE